MSFRTRLQKATFRSIPFFVRKHDYSGGRRLVKHEYATTDTLYIEDLGRQEDTYAIKAFVIGSDYDLERDRLEKALLESGEGVLIHPYLGRLTVQVQSFSLKEKSIEGGMAVFDITFLRSGEAPALPELSPKEAIPALQAQALTATNEDFEENYQGGGLAGKLLARTKSALSVASLAMKRVMRGTKVAEATLGEVAHKLEVFDKEVNDILKTPQAITGALGGVAHKLNDILKTPQAITGALGGVYSALFGIKNTLENADPVGNAKANLQALRVNRLLREQEKSKPSKTAPTSNELAIQALQERTEAIYAASLLTQTNPTTTLELETSLSFVEDWLEEVGSTDNRELFESLRELRLGIRRAMMVDYQHLLELTAIHIDTPIPSAVLAHKLGMSEADLIAINNPPNPLFMRGDIQVFKGGLNDA